MSETEMDPEWVRPGILAAPSALPPSSILESLYQIPTWGRGFPARMTRNSLR